MLNVGVIVGERYEVVGKVGSGGMADVYKAKDHKLNRFVAMKVLKPEFSADTTFIRKFQREAEAAAGLAHPNIVNVFDVGEDQGVNYIVMELVEGITLKEYISRKGKLTVKEATSIAIQVAMGLEAAHNRNIVHRDIKPQNIIISTDGKVKVTDFGIARAASSNTISTNAMGSVHYSSPEQVRGGYSDYKSDIYSLGITIYEMVTGHVPFDGDTTVAIAIKHLQDEMVPPSEFAPDLPHSLEEIIMKCTQKSPDRRYNTLAELINDLKHSLIDPDGNFVNLTPLSNHAQTVVISQDEMSQIKSRGYTPEDSSEDDEEDYGYDNYGDDDDEEEYDDDEDGGKGISTKLEKAMTIGGLIIGAIIICILVYFIVSATDLFKFGSSDKDTNTKTESTSKNDKTQVEVPDLTGKTQDEAQEILYNLQLGYKKAGEEASSTVEAGNICRQEIEAGTKVDAHTEIKCYVSSGNAEVEIPDLVGMDQTTAEASLKELGLKTKIQKANSSSVEIGSVISSDPAAGESVQAGAEVTLTISVGEGDTAVRVPSVVGQPEADAKSTLETLGLIVDVKTGESQNVGVGEVYDQSVESGTRADTGTHITIYVRKDSASADNQDNTDNTNNTNNDSQGTWKAAPQALGIPEQFIGEVGTLVLVQTDADGNEYRKTIVEDATLNVGENGGYSISDITGEPGIGTGKVELYINDILITEFPDVVFQKVD